MSITRKLPNSDQGRSRALNRAKSRRDTVLPADMAITPGTIVRLDIIQPDFKSKMLARGVAANAQTASSGTVQSTARTLRLRISHFIQTFNFGVDRGVFAASDRAYYQLATNKAEVPSLATEDDIIEWGGRIVSGEAARVAAGGTAMGFPLTAADVNAALTAFTTANNAQSNKKLAYDQAQEAVAALRDEADKVTKKVWDEVETFYNEDEISSVRRKAREWGVVYVSDIPEVIHLTVTSSATHAGIVAQVEVIETGDLANTAADGKADIKTSVVNEVTLSISAADHTTREVTVPFVNGVHEYVQAVELAHV